MIAPPRRQILNFIDGSFSIADILISDDIIEFKTLIIL